MPSENKLATALCLLLLELAAGGVLAAVPGPKPREPLRVLKPTEGYFDQAFATDSAARRLALIRTDGATFAKLEIADLETGALKASFDLPGQALAVERIELLPEGQGVVLVTREGAGEGTRLTATLLDAAGHVVANQGPATDFGIPAPAPGKTDPAFLVAFDRKEEKGGAATVTLTPFHLAKLAPAGKRRAYHVSAEGELKAPVFRLFGFYDGYTRASGEQPGAYDKTADMRAPARMATLDTLSGKLQDDAEIADVRGWVEAARMRPQHPGRGRFATLNFDGSGVDIVDAMGKKQPAELAIPFRFYEPKSLHDQEGPERGAFYLGLAVDPLNPDAIKRQKADLPMLDVYAQNPPADGLGTATKLRARVFTPRPVIWRVGYGKLVVLKRFKSFTRGGDELQIYDLK